MAVTYYILGPVLDKQITFVKDGIAADGVLVPCNGLKIIGLLWETRWSGGQGVAFSKGRPEDTGGGSLPTFWPISSTETPINQRAFFGPVEPKNVLAQSMSFTWLGTHAEAEWGVHDMWAGFENRAESESEGEQTILSNFQAMYEVGTPDSASEHDAGSLLFNCYCWGAQAEPMTANPIQLRTGQKVQVQTDLAVQSPSGTLEFVRSYLQDKLRSQDARYQFMGLGWTHNHAMLLTLEGTSPNRIARVRMEDGGVLKLTQNGSQYEATAGASGLLVPDSSDYLLKVLGKNVYRFEPTGTTDVYRLKTRTWPSGDEWHYTYSSGKLTQVADDYGRALKLAYINNPSGFDDGQLWRVGDHSVSNLSSVTSTDRYVEFGYVQERSNGSLVTGGKALLSSVRDVRNNTWTYGYYGQLSGESDSAKQNFLLKRLSPPFRDAGGSIITSSEVGLETLDYTLSGSTITQIVQRRGLSDPATASTAKVVKTLAFSSNQTTETVQGKTTTHHFDNGVYRGATDPLGKLSERLYGLDYRPFAQRDANHHTTLMVWGGDGKRLETVVDAAGNATSFDYDSQDRLILTTDAEGRQTLYAYDAVRRNPTQIVVAATAGEIDVKGDMEGVLADWTVVNSPLTTHALVTSPVDSGAQARHVEASTAGKGVESPAWNIADDITYLVVARVKRVSGTVKLVLADGSGTPPSVSATTGTDWQTLRLLYTATSPVTGAKIQCLAEGGAAEFYVDGVHLLEVTQLQRWQEFIYDDKARVLAERTLTPASGAVQQETTRSYYTTGNGDGLLETQTQVDVLTPANNTSTTYIYDSAGRVTRTQQSSLFGNCSFTYTLYDLAGNITRTVCSSASVSTPETATADATTKVTVHEYDTLGRRIKSTSDYGASYAQTSLMVYDALDQAVRTVSNYVAQGGSDPATWMWDSSDARWERADGTPIDHGSGSIQNRLADTLYNARGLVRKTVDTLGSVTLYGYDDAGRQIKTIQNASQPGYNNDDVGGSPDPTLASYTASAAPDLDLVTTTAYDAAGNVVKTVDVLGNVSYTVYDALNRVIKTVRSAKATATIALQLGDSGYDATLDPRSTLYVPSSDPDRDLIQATTYDSVGRAIEQTDTLGRISRTVYDSQGRVVKTIANYVAQGATDPATWVWDNGTDQRWERADGTAIDHGTSNDQNIISLTVYGADNRVLYSQDVLGRRAWTKYDGLGRQVKTITNAVGTATDNGTSDPRSDTYSASTDSDKDRITRTEYDSDGRVQWTQDANGRKAWRVYDTQGRQVKTIVNCTYVSGSPAPEDVSYTGSSDPDDDIITHTEYDDQGRVWKTFDPLGRETRFEYDVLGRRIQTTTNYVNGVYSAAAPDEDLIETTTYDLAGRVISTIDARGTKTAFIYDGVGRRRIVTQAADSPLEGETYTCFDKAGRVQRTIHNWRDTGVSPDAKDGSGNWLFVPADHGLLEDRDLITSTTYDKLGRVLSTTDVIGNVSSTTYDKAGQMLTMTDPLSIVTTYRYDTLRRRAVVVQNYVAQGGSDPSTWHWNGTNWQRSSSDSTAIVHGADNDQNVIVKVAQDKAGRMTSLRNPRGQLTNYTYDLLNRRLTLTNPLSKTWATVFTDVSGGTTRATLTDPNGEDTRRTFDRLGRVQQVGYLAESPKLTPDVTFTYDKGSNRLKMSESDGSSTIRETNYGYDDVRRLTSVGFDTDGNGTVNETVSYEYDAGGRRTKLTLPGSLVITYTYDMRGQLVGLTDWDSQPTAFAYDLAGRHVATERTINSANRLHTRYGYDAGGRLRLLRHTQGSNVLAHFAYDVDGRGNRTRALEAVRKVGGSTTTIAHNDKSIVTSGMWNTVGSFKETTDTAAELETLFFGRSNVTLTLGIGPDHGLVDVYVGGSLWETLDGYAASASERNVVIPLAHDGPHLLELRCRRDKSSASSGYKVRFKQLGVDGQYDLHTLEYGYDALARLREARVNPGANVAVADADLLRRYLYTYDLAGNRLSQSIAINGASPTVTNYTYNAANQLTSDGTNTLSYDDNGNLTSDGVNGYAWDRANRLLSMGGSSYVYDGLGNRITQTISANVTKYLLDLQPGLAVALSDTTGANTNRYIHSLRGIHAQKDTAGNWEHPLQDGLGSVRGMVDNSGAVLESRQYEPYGVPFGTTGTSQTAFGFTGELTDPNELLLLRARYYKPSLGVFTRLDPFEGIAQRPMSLNGYNWVEGNVANAIDPTGMIMSSMVVEALNNGICLGQDGGEPTPTPGALSNGPLNNTQVASATVTIAMDDYPNCTSPNQVQRSLGVISNRGGVWTHDHYLGLLGPGNFGSVATNNQQAETYLRSWPCITFTGPSGSATITGDDLQVDLLQSVQGALFLPDSQTDYNGNSVSLMSLGMAANENTAWVPNGNESIQVPYIYGNNITANLSDHSVISIFQLNVDASRGLGTGPEGRQAYVSLTTYSLGSERINSGDSGGGVFSDQGELIGVTLGVTYSEGWFTTRFEHWFVPLN